MNSNTFRVSENVKEGSTEATACVARLPAVPLWVSLDSRAAEQIRHHRRFTERRAKVRRVERASKYAIIGDPPSERAKVRRVEGVLGKRREEKEELHSFL